MRLDYKRDKELQRRKGLTVRTVLIVIWLAICFAAAFYFVNWLFESEALSYNTFYGRLHIPASVSRDVIRIILMIVLTLLMQIFLLMGYAISSPLGRARPGKPSLRSREPDPDERHFYR